MADTYQTLDGVRTTPELDSMLKEQKKLYDEIKRREGKPVDEEGIYSTDEYNALGAQYKELTSKIESITKKLKSNQQSALAPGLTAQTQGSALMGGSTNQSVLTPLG